MSNISRSQVRRKGGKERKEGRRLGMKIGRKEGRKVEGSYVGRKQVR